MKLFITPGTCSLSPHIVLHELGIPFELEPVTRDKKLMSGGNYLAEVNPKGPVPALKLDSGEVLTEGPVIVQYLADQKPEAGLIPRPGTIERYRLQEWLNYLTSDIHKNFSPLFNPKISDEAKALFRELLGRRLDYIAKHLDTHDYLMGKTFSVADAYLFVLLSWAPGRGVTLPWPSVVKFQERVGARPAVKKAQDEEKQAREKI
jgi:glutathione S-transferase